MEITWRFDGPESIQDLAVSSQSCFVLEPIVGKIIKYKSLFKDLVRTYPYSVLEVLLQRNGNSKELVQNLLSTSS